MPCPLFGWLFQCIFSLLIPSNSSHLSIAIISSGKHKDHGIYTMGKPGMQSRHFPSSRRRTETDSYLINHRGAKKGANPTWLITEGLSLELPRLIWASPRFAYPMEDRSKRKTYYLRLDMLIGRAQKNPTHLCSFPLPIPPDQWSPSSYLQESWIDMSELTDTTSFHDFQKDRIS